MYANRSDLPIQSIIPTGLHPVALPRLSPNPSLARHAVTGEDWESPQERTGMSQHAITTLYRST